MKGGAWDWETPLTPLILCLLRLHGLRSGARSQAKRMGEAGVAAVSCRQWGAGCVTEASG